MRSVFRSAAALVLALLGLLLAAVGGAAAGNPDRQQLPTPPDISVACPQGFSATAHVAINGEYISTFTMPDGTTRLQIEGRFVTTVTGNGRTLTLNSSGPATIYIHPDGSVAIVDLGPVFYIAPDLSGFWLYYGHVVVDPNTGLVLSHAGAVTDVCALLAA